MIPLRDTIPNHRPPVAVYLLLGANVLAFLAQSVVPPQALDALIDLFAVHPDRFNGAGTSTLTRPPVVYASLISSQYLHGDLLHLAGNMWTLWIFGDNVEDRMGSARFLVFYTVCGILAGLLHVVTEPGSPIPTLGASGAIAGVMGAYLFLFPKSQVVLFVPLIVIPLFFRTSAIFFLVLWFVIQGVSGGVQSMHGESVIGVAYWAHVGGFAAGAALHRLFCRPPSRQRPLYRDELGPFGAWS